MKLHFTDKDPSIETTWRSIVLLGNNVASYKFALAKTLLELPDKLTKPSLEELSLPFALNLCEHLTQNSKQITSKSSKFLNYCNDYNNSVIDEDELGLRAKQLGFVNVIDAFHTVARSPVPVRFFDDDRANSKSIVLTDSIFELKKSLQAANLLDEVEARWKLWEKAITIGVTPGSLIVHSDSANDLYIEDQKLRRLNITPSRDALMGYQKGKCFYCGTFISTFSGSQYLGEVDHFFPFYLYKKTSRLFFRKVEEVWNHVLACNSCNGAGGKSNSLAESKFLEKLHRRNNYYIDSHHPLKETIIAQTGSTEQTRIDFLQNFLSESTGVITSKKWAPSEVEDESI